MTQLYLIRHAKNDWVGDRLAGSTPGVRLNEDGRTQAAALAARLAALPFDAVYASPLERAQETAAYVARPHRLEVRTLPGVAEIDFGDWTGESLETLRKDPLWAGVQFYPSGTRFPGGETMREAQSRALAALAEVGDAHPKGVVAVVSHADVIRLLLAHYLGVHIDGFQRLVVDTASLSVVQLHAQRPYVLRVNDTGELPPPPKREEPSEDGSGAEPSPREE